MTTPLFVCLADENMLSYNLGAKLRNRGSRMAQQPYHGSFNSLSIHQVHQYPKVLCPA